MNFLWAKESNYGMTVLNSMSLSRRNWRQKQRTEVCKRFRLNWFRPSFDVSGWAKNLKLLSFVYLDLYTRNHWKTFEQKILRNKLISKPLRRFFPEFYRVMVVHGEPSNLSDDKNISLVYGIKHAITTHWNDKLLKAEATWVTLLAIDNGHIWCEIHLCRMRFEEDSIISFT